MLYELTRDLEVVRESEEAEDSKVIRNDHAQQHSQQQLSPSECSREQQEGGLAISCVLYL